MSMIEQSAAMPLLVEACPSFSEQWQEHLAENGSDLAYVAAGEFARHLLHLYRSNDSFSLSAVGAAIERLHIEGSPSVKEFATIGVLEGVQNVWSHSNIDPELFVPFLGPVSQRWWNGLNKFWSGKVPHVNADA